VELRPVDGPFDVLGVQVLPLDVMHGQLPVLGFRMGDFGYVTDASYVPDETVRRLQGVRYLILNALRHRPHPTHMNVAQALEIVQRISPEHAWFTHITHDLDHETTNRELPDGVDLAHDGLQFTVDVQAGMPEPR
jgi:phosphoribosyl 1,2-cyclic phosphate phosphodiesterase